MQITTAAEVRKRLPPIDAKLVEEFNTQIDAAIKRGWPFEMYLSFTTFGSTEADVQFIRRAGFQIQHSGGHTCWVVTLA